LIEIDLIRWSCYSIQREKEKEVEFDIESGENTSKEDTSDDERDSNSKNGFPWSWNGVMNSDGSEKAKNGIGSIM